MKKNLKLFTALVAVVLVAGASIFYACEKENQEGAIDNNLKKEASFVAKNYDDMCVQVDIFRDEDGNAHFAIKDVASDPEVAVRCIIPETLNIPTRKTKNGESVVSEIPNDAIYWLVPLDGHDPIKFVPSKDAKAAASSYVYYNCECDEAYGYPANSHCEVEKELGKAVRCKNKTGGKCIKCRMITKGTSSYSDFILVGSSYLVQSNTITIGQYMYE